MRRKTNCVRDFGSRRLFAFCAWRRVPARRRFCSPMRHRTSDRSGRARVNSAGVFSLSQRPGKISTSGNLHTRPFRAKSGCWSSGGADSSGTQRCVVNELPNVSATSVPFSRVSVAAIHLHQPDDLRVAIPPPQSSAMFHHAVKAFSVGADVGCVRHNSGGCEPIHGSGFRAGGVAKSAAGAVK